MLDVREEAMCEECMEVYGKIWDNKYGHLRGEEWRKVYDETYYAGLVEYATKKCVCVARDYIVDGRDHVEYFLCERHLRAALEALRD